MKIKAAKVIGVQKIEIQDMEIGKPKENEVLIKVQACGICSTEMAVYKGTTIGVEGVSFHYKEYPANLGHEVVGYVVEKGPGVTSFDVGDCVAGLTYSGCGYAEYIVEHEVDLIKITDPDQSKHHLYMMEPVMGTTNIVHQMDVKLGDDVVIVGDGFMSLLLVNVLSHFPLNNLIVVGHHDWKLKKAKGFGASVVINSNSENAWEHIMDLTHGKGSDVSVDYAGSKEALRLSASICKPKVRSKLFLAAAYSNDTPFIIANYLQNRSPVIMPAYPHQSLNKVKDLARGLWGVNNGIYKMDELITHTFNFSNINDAFQKNIDREVGYIKGVMFPVFD